MSGQNTGEVKLREEGYIFLESPGISIKKKSLWMENLKSRKV